MTDEAKKSTEEQALSVQSIASKVPEKWRQKALSAMTRMLLGTESAARLYTRGAEQIAFIDAKADLEKQIAVEMGKRAVASDTYMAEQELRYFGRHLSRAANAEGVAVLALEHLAESTIETGSGSSEDADDVGEVEDDWLNVFARYAEDASSDRLRDLWARILAGEIRQPGQFNYRFMRTLAEMDSATAHAFQVMRERYVPNVFITLGSVAQPPIDELQRLKILSEAGLCERFVTHINWPYSNGSLILQSNNIALVCEGGGAAAQHPGVGLTETGLALVDLVTPSDRLAGLKSFVNWTFHRFEKIIMYDMSRPGSSYEIVYDREPNFRNSAFFASVR